MQTFQEDDNVDITSYSTLETCEESTNDRTDFDDVNDFYCVNESGTSGDCRLIFSLIFLILKYFPIIIINSSTKISCQVILILYRYFYSSSNEVSFEYKKRAVELWRNPKKSGERQSFSVVQKNFKTLNYFSDLHRWAKCVDDGGTKPDKIALIKKNVR